MKPAVAGEALDGGHSATVLHDGERHARVNPLAVNQHRARAALAVVAALLGAGEVKVLAKQVQQRCPRRNAQLLDSTVDRDGHRNLVRQSGHAGLGTQRLVSRFWTETTSAPSDEPRLRSYLTQPTRPREQRR